MGDQHITTYSSGATLQGNAYRDLFCVSSSTGGCVNSFKYYDLTSKGIMGYLAEGFIGLWNGKIDGKSELFVPKLYDSGAISEKKFSTYLSSTSDTTNGSFIDFGAPKESIVGDYSNVHWVPTNEQSNWWSSHVYGYKWDDRSEADEDKMEVEFSSPSEADIDSYSSCISGPASQISSIVIQILS